MENTGSWSKPYRYSIEINLDNFGLLNIDI